MTDMGQCNPDRLHFADADASGSILAEYVYSASGNPVVKDLEKQGKATIYDKMVFFQNGKIIEEKPVVKENLTTEKPKKEKKAKTVPLKDVNDLAAEAELIPLDEAEELIERIIMHCRMKHLKRE